MADNRPNVYIEDDGLVVYRASSIGMCVKALVAIAHGGYEEAMGQERVEMLNRTADEGDLHEGAVRDKLAKEGWVIHSAQDVVEVPIIEGKVVIRGHTDGVISSAKNEPPMLLEVKSMSNKRFDRWTKQGFDGFAKYAYQISAYMKAHEGMDVVYVVKRREDGLEARQIIKTTNPPVEWKAIRKKILAAEGFRRKGKGFPACDVPRSEQWWCPFWYLHDEDEIDSTIEMTEEMKAILIELIPQRMELSDTEKDGIAAGEMRKELDKEILNLMGTGDQVVVEIEGIDYQVTRVKSRGTSLDAAKLRVDLGDDYAQYEKGYTYQFPKITEKKSMKKKGSE